MALQRQADKGLTKRNSIFHYCEMALQAPYIILADLQRSKDGDPLPLGAARAETEIISNIAVKQ